ncbi:flagellar filament capping protein FliD [Paraclostridium bifermentans]|uniref:flagellar filament capping protein FliD n=1 Tax=Paraclostridium bifermentans TaxID=1490 RepID=UPI00038D6C77|nr:flagellar filament capping protein FliD [Paraclostridium bifermentans]EQK45868.1 flagellar hook-associated family protein [[Clostridium] bifermentans ATCC 19299] [Paraclostridium bifermentans ATCC 19299]MCE9675759.1 flagellar filament capping protein FliD [Paraclostridium bifermentans]
MSSVNSVSSTRIPGLATGMDTDQMIKDMLTGEQNKVDRAKQKEQITKWQQENYREIIKNVKGLYDKYFSATSPDFILGSKVFSTVMINSSNSNVISAVAGAGANKIDYKFKVDEMAKPPSIETGSMKIDKNKTMEEQGFVPIDGKSEITINGVNISISGKDKITDVVDKINKKFPNGEIKSTYSEMTGKFTVEGNKTGKSQSINVQGDLFNNLGMLTDTSISIVSKKIDANKTLKEQGIEGEISINGNIVKIDESDNISDLVNKINSTDKGVKAELEEGQLKITSNSNNGIELTGKAFEKMGIDVNNSEVSITNLDKDKPLLEQGITSPLKINGKEIKIDEKDTASTLVDKINKEIPGTSASIDELTGEIKIQSKDVLNFENFGVTASISKPKTQAITTQAIQGSNNKVTVYDKDGKTELNTIIEESNSFTIDNITYNVNGVNPDGDLVSMSSSEDTKQTVEKLQAFINDYNKMMDDIYKSVTEKKNKDYPPLTEAQKEEMSEEEIEKWEKKAKEGMLKNDRELRNFMEDIKKVIFEPIGDLGVTLRDIGIKSDDDYNKPGQIHLDVDKFTKALKEDGDLVYKATTGAFGKIKDVTYKYAGSSGSIFVKKAGMEKTSSAVNNLFSEQLKRQEAQIKNLTRKMKEKESDLYKKFARLEANMNKLNSQMSYLSSSMGM